MDALASSKQSIVDLLGQVAQGKVSVDQAFLAMRRLPFETTDSAMLDHHRSLRNGFGEVVYCEGKTSDQVAEIFEKLAETSGNLLGTRATRQQFESAQACVPQLQYHDAARAIWLDREPTKQRMTGVVVVAAGTSDLAVAEEAIITLKLMGHEPARLVDVGVAGLHRLLHHLDVLQSANVIVAAAGMEGALPSVIGGLVSAPVIAVPTSIGYGTSLNGLTALFSMLNSCAAGVSVVNIDNGFGAGYNAAIINEKIEGSRKD